MSVTIKEGGEKMEQNSNKNSDVSREIITRYGTIRRPNTSNIEINVISWNKGKRKLDIRPWSKDGVIAMKGITLSREGVIALKKILNSVDISLIDSESKGADRRVEPNPPPPVEPANCFNHAQEAEQLEIYDEECEISVSGEEEELPIMTDEQYYEEDANIIQECATQAESAEQTDAPESVAS